MKVATVDVEGGDNMATLPVSRSHTAGSTDSAEKNNAANKEMELKNVMPQPLQRCAWGTIEAYNGGGGNKGEGLEIFLSEREQVSSRRLGGRGYPVKCGCSVDATQGRQTQKKKRKRVRP